MLPHDDKINQSSSVSRNQGIIAASYGDGYEQRALFGINQTKTAWSINWIPLIDVDHQDILDFWESVGVVVEWSWAAPGDISRKYRFDSGINVSNVGDKYILSTSISEVF